MLLEGDSSDIEKDNINFMNIFVSGKMKNAAKMWIMYQLLIKFKMIAESSYCVWHFSYAA